MPDRRKLLKVGQGGTGLGGVTERVCQGGWEGAGRLWAGGSPPCKTLNPVKHHRHSAPSSAFENLSVCLSST